MTIPEIAPDEVNTKRQRLIDVRSPEEFVGELGHVPGSELITMGDELIHALENMDRSEEIVFVCRSGNRSGNVTAYAIDKGFTKVFNMSGGMLLWNDLGLEVEK